MHKVMDGTTVILPRPQHLVDTYSVNHLSTGSCFGQFSMNDAFLNVGDFRLRIFAEPALSASSHTSW